MMIVKKVVKWFLITTGSVFVLLFVIGLIVGVPPEEVVDSSPAVTEPVVNTEPVVATEPVQEQQPLQPEVKTETVEEMQARWDRGEFTAEEIAEIRAEEKREDRALKLQGY